MIVFVIDISRTRSADIAININESTFAKIQEPLSPILQTFLLHQTIHIHTINGPLNLDIDPVSLRYIHYDDFSITTNIERGGVDLQARNLDILVQKLKVNIHRTVAGSPFSCVYYSSPNISKWNISLNLLQTRPENGTRCNLEISANKSLTAIIEGHTTFNWEFGSSFCRSAFRVADELVGVKATVINMLVKEIKRFIDRDLANVANVLLEQVSLIETGEYHDGHKILMRTCFPEVEVRDDSVYLGAVFNVEEEQHAVTIGHTKQTVLSTE